MKNRKICGVPFSNFMLHVDPKSNGNIIYMACCPAWLNPPYNSSIMSIPEDDSGFINLDSLWNSKSMVTFRKSVVDGSYSFCNILKCPYYVSDDLSPLPDRAKELIERGVFEMDYPPSYIQANIDRACNLTCPSCREYPNAQPNPKSYVRLKSLLLSGVESIYLNGTGEIFRNQYLLSALNEITKETYPNLKTVGIISNGTLLNKTMWASLSKGFKSLVKRIDISVDAASEQIYRKVRVGGNFSRLLDNLHFIGSLKKENEIENFSISLVLQKVNIHELLNFIKLAKDVNADAVCILRIEDWHARPHQEFLDNMALPVNWEVTYKDYLEEARKLAVDNSIYFFSNL